MERAEVAAVGVGVRQQARWCCTGTNVTLGDAVVFRRQFGTSTRRQRRQGARAIMFRQDQDQHHHRTRRGQRLEHLQRRPAVGVRYDNIGGPVVPTVDGAEGPVGLHRRSAGSAPSAPAGPEVVGAFAVVQRHARHRDAPGHAARCCRDAAIGVAKTAPASATIVARLAGGMSGAGGATARPGAQSAEDRGVGRRGGGRDRDHVARLRAFALLGQRPRSRCTAVRSTRADQP